MNTHFHITAWVLAVILLIVVVVLHKQGKAKGAKITHMILRLAYLLILISGGILLYKYFTIEGMKASLRGEVVVKAIAGIWVIYAMEMIGVKTAKGKPTKGVWIQLIIAFLITLILGFGRLPFGILP
ncbi:YisL family protein [Virgibacillus soli]|uniref:YisL family protein n=1 Tax=Paracerasibacillus soli TaxID=480284 RepID=UPI0035E58FEC